MVNESLTTRLARERLAALNAFIPLRNRVRDKLNQRQLAQTDFSAETEQLFAPITTATKEATAKTERAIWGDIPDLEKDPTKSPRKETPLLTALENIAAETKKTQQRRKQILTQIQQEVDQLPDIEEQEQEEEPKQTRRYQRGVPFINTIKEDKIKEIRSHQLNKPEDVIQFGRFASQQYHQRRDFLKDEYKNSSISKDNWTDWLYKINQGITGNLKKETMMYRDFKKGVNKYGLQRQQPQQERELSQRREEWDRLQEELSQRREERQQRQAQLLDDSQDDNQDDNQDDSQGATGRGFLGRDKNRRFSPLTNPRIGQQTGLCPGNILGDISRLEVLVGGKRAGNNSPEIINEAADICRRLFQGGLMNINLYRELIEELAENRHDLDYGYENHADFSD